jgi:uncharacterized membrane protein
MSEWGVQDWVLFFGAVGTMAVTVLGALIPLVRALKENTQATVTSANAMTTTAVAVEKNTVATEQVAQSLPPSSPVTVNVGDPAQVQQEPHSEYEPRR